MNIDKCSNGYILTYNDKSVIAENIEEVFNRMLSYFEGRNVLNKGNTYGKVIVQTVKNREELQW